MEDRRLWFLLNEVAGALGMEVRLERLADDEEYSVKSGLCRIKGQPVVFVDRRLPMPERCRQLGRGLLGLQLEGVYLRPAVRDYLQGLGESQGQGEE